MRQRDRALSLPAWWSPRFWREIAPNKGDIRSAKVKVKRECRRRELIGSLPIWSVRVWRAWRILPTISGGLAPPVARWRLLLTVLFWVCCCQSRRGERRGTRLSVHVSWTRFCVRRTKLNQVDRCILSRTSARFRHRRSRGERLPFEVLRDPWHFCLRSNPRKRWVWRSAACSHGCLARSRCGYWWWV